MSAGAIVEELLDCKGFYPIEEDDTTSLGSIRGDAFRFPGLCESIVWILRFSEILCWNSHMASVADLRER